MSDRSITEPTEPRSLPSWLGRLLLFFVIAMAALGAVAAGANDLAEGADPSAQVDGGADAALSPSAPHSYRERALIALLTNERRSIDERIGQVTARLERLAADDASPETAALQQELESLEQRLGDIAVELATLEEPSPAAPATAEAAAQPIFIPAIKPRQPEETASAEARPLTLAERQRIQEALVFLGGYDSTIDGDFGARTETAIRRFQSGIGAEPTGSLTDQQKATLLDEAEALRRTYAIQPLRDEAIGFELLYPGALLSEAEPSDGGYRQLSDESGEATLQVVEIDSRDLRTVFDDLTRHADGGYRHLTDSWFVASGDVDGTMYYSMGRLAGGRSVVAHLTYPTEERDRWDPFTVVLYNSFKLTKEG